MKTTSLKRNSYNRPRKRKAPGDSQLLAPCRDALRQSPYPSLRLLEVTDEDDQIVLRGVVETYYMKQLAQETARRCCRNRRVNNRIVVRWTPASSN